jgi:hypothetical protein
MMAATTVEPETDPQTGRWATLREAGETLGISEDSVRRRLRNRQLHGRRVGTAQGFQWRVWVGPGVPPPTAAAVEPDTGGPSGPAASAPGGADSAPDGADSAPHGAETPAESALALARMRAEEMAAYTRALLEPLHAQLKEQAEQVGRLSAEVGHLQEQLASERTERERWEAVLAEAEEAERAAESAQSRRPWWRFW